MKKILKKIINGVDEEKYSNNKICITFVGGPGFGKTTITKLLCNKLPLFHCSNDYIAREIEKMGTDISDYEARTKLVSEIAFPFQDYLFEQSIDFVLDANLMLYLDVIKSRCKNYGYDLFVIELKISHEEALKRSLERLKRNDKDNLSNSDAKDFELFLKQLKDYKQKENKDDIFACIDMTKDLDSQINDVVKKICDYKSKKRI